MIQKSPRWNPRFVLVLSQSSKFSPKKSTDGSKLVGGWTSPFEKIVVKLNHFCQDRGENSKNIWVATTQKTRAPGWNHIECHLPLGPCLSNENGFLNHWPKSGGFFLDGFFADSKWKKTFRKNPWKSLATILEKVLNLTSVTVLRKLKVYSIMFEIEAPIFEWCENSPRKMPLNGWFSSGLV